MLALSLIPFVSANARNVTRFEETGDCFELVQSYLKARGVAFIVSPALRGRACAWNFQGNTLSDFETWCKSEGLTCGGNPYQVKYDSAYNAEGVRTSARQAQVSWERKRKEDRTQAQSDSVRLWSDSLQKALSVPLPAKRVFLEYLELSRATAEKIGFSYSEYIGKAEFVDYTDLFSVTIQARKEGDTTYTYRNYSSVYDSSLTLFWGGKRQRATSSTYAEGGFVTSNYEDEEYGLRISLDGMKYSYEHSRDYENSIRGNGLLVRGENRIFGTYKTYERIRQGIPWLMDIPLLGTLFRWESTSGEWRYIYLRVVVEDGV